MKEVSMRGPPDYASFGNNGNYKKLLREFINKDNSPGKRFFVDRNFAKKHRKLGK